MNPLTNVRKTAEMNERELALGVTGNLKQSWHQKYKDSAWLYIGGLPFDLTEGDVTCVFSQYGEVVNINLIRDRKTGKSRGFCFLCYEDQRSTILAVDNMNGIKLLNRTIRVDHVENYKVPKEFEDMDPEARRLMEEGCAPKPLSQEPVNMPTKLSKPSEDTDHESDSKHGIKRKKHKKKKIKKEKRLKTEFRRESSSCEKRSAGSDTPRLPNNAAGERAAQNIPQDPSSKNVGANFFRKEPVDADSRGNNYNSGIGRAERDTSESWRNNNAEGREIDADVVSTSSNPSKKSHPAFKSKLFSKKVVRRTDEDDLSAGKGEKKFSHDDIQPNIPNRYA